MAEDDTNFSFEPLAEPEPVADPVAPAADFSFEPLAPAAEAPVVPERESFEPLPAPETPAVAPEIEAFREGLGFSRLDPNKPSPLVKPTDPSEPPRAFTETELQEKGLTPEQLAEIEPFQGDPNQGLTPAQGALSGVSRGVARLGTQFFIKPARGIAATGAQVVGGLTDAVRATGFNPKIFDDIDKANEAILQPTGIEKELSADSQERLTASLEKGDIGAAAGQLLSEGGLDMATGLLQIMMLGSGLKAAGIGKGGAALIRPGLAGGTKAIMSGAAIRGLWSYLTTPGTAIEKLKSGALTTAFMSTPALARNFKFAKLADLTLNSLLSANPLGGAYKDAWEATKEQVKVSGGGKGDFIKLLIANALPTLMSDLIASSGTKYKGDGQKAVAAATKAGGAQTELTKRIVEGSDALVEKFQSPEGEVVHKSTAKSPELMTLAEDTQRISPTEKIVGKASRIVPPSQRNFLRDAYDSNKPVNAEAADAFAAGHQGSRPLAIPEGYVREGPNYVHKSTAKATPLPKTQAEADPFRPLETTEAQKPAQEARATEALPKTPEEATVRSIEKQIGAASQKAAEEQGITAPNLRDMGEPEFQRLAEGMGVSTEGGRFATEKRVLAEINRATVDEQGARKRRGALPFEAPQEKVTITKDKLLKAQIRAERRAAKDASKIARIETVAEFRAQSKAKQLDVAAKRQFVKEFAEELLDKPNADRVKLIADKAKTPATFERAIRSIENLSEKIEGGEARVRFAKELAGAEGEKLTPFFQRSLDKLKSDFEKSALGEKKLLNLQATQRFIRENPNHNVPEKLLEELKRLDKTAISKMTTQDVNNLSDALASMRSQSKLKKSIIAKRQNRTIKEHSEDFVASIRPSTKKIREVRPGLQEPKGGLGNKFKLASMGLEAISQEIDGGKDGVATDILFKNTIKVGQEKRARADAGVAEFVMPKLEEAGIPRADLEKWSQPMLDEGSTSHKVLKVGGKNFAHRVGPKAKSVSVKTDAGDTLTMTYGEITKLYRLSKNERAMRNLMDQEKGGIRLAENQKQKFKLTPADLEKIFEQVPPEVLKVADIMHEYENTIQKDGMNKTSLERIGIEIAREADYVRAERSDLDVGQRGVQKSSGSSSSINDQALDDRGFNKEKTNVRAPLVIRDGISSFFNDARNVNHYIGMAEPLAQAKAFMSRNQVRRAITANFGENTVKAIDKAIREIENPLRLSDNVITRTTEAARQNIVKASLGAGGVLGGVVAKQPVSYITAVTEMPAKYLNAAITKSLPSNEDVAKSSAILGSRIQSGRFERDVGAANSARNFWTGKTTLGDKLMKPTSAADALAVKKIWTAAKLEIEDTKPNLKGDAKLQAIGQRAEEVVRRTQPTFDVEDRSAIARSQEPLTKLATSFTSQLNKNAQMIIRTVNTYKNSAKTASDKAKLAKNLTAVMVVAPFLIAGIDELREGVLTATGVKKKKKDKKSLAARLAYKTLQNNLNVVYVGGQILSSAVNKAVGEGFISKEGINNIVSSNLANFSQGLGGVAKGALAGEWDEKTMKSARRLFIALNNMVTGLPVGPVLKDVETAVKGAQLLERDRIPVKRPSRTRKTRRKR